MFTGIVEAVGEVKKIVPEQGNLIFHLSSPFLHELKIDQSVAHNGVCLTVTSVADDTYTVTAIGETLKRTNLSGLKPGSKVNLERCMKVGDRLDGHIVQGHVDTTAICTTIDEEEGSWKFFFTHDHHPDFVTVEKGSITVNGVSLTVVDSRSDEFSVAIIPYTFGHTNFKYLRAGDKVNLEFDVIGKYVARLIRPHSA